MLYTLSVGAYYGRLLVLVPCCLIIIASANPLARDPLGLSLDRSKVLVGWTAKCTTTIDKRDSSLIASIATKNPSLFDAVTKLGRRRALHAVDFDERLSFHRGQHVGGRRRLNGERDDDDDDLPSRRDHLLTFLDVLVAAREDEEVPLQSLLDTGQKSTVSLPTGLDFDAPIRNGPRSGLQFSAKYFTSLERWHKSSRITDCPRYGQQQFTPSMHLLAKFLSDIGQDVIEVPCGITGEEVVALVTSLPCVDFAHIDIVRQPLSVEASTLEEDKEGKDLLKCPGCTVPSDLTVQQWHLVDNIFGSVNPQRAWSQHTGYRDQVVVAVLDTGAGLHPDFSANMYENSGEAGDLCHDGIDNDGNGYIDDCHGWHFGNDHNDPSLEEMEHGTPVSGAMGARGDNQYGTLGTCPFCRIMSLNIASSSGLLVSSITEALNYVLIMGVKISNNSYGAYGFSLAEYTAIQSLRKEGHVFVAAAGNDKCDLDGTFCSVGAWSVDPSEKPFCPCSYDLDNIVCVGATTRGDRLSRFSNYGSKTVHIFAPGSDIFTLSNPRLSGRETGSVDGTSFSAPITAGAIGLKVGRNPDWSYKEIISALKKTARQNANLQNRSQSGALDVNSFIEQSADTSDLEPDDVWPVQPPASGGSLISYSYSCHTLTLTYKSLIGCGILLLFISH